MTLPEDKIHQLHKILLSKLLPWVGFKFNFPHTVAFASHELLGVGVKILKAVHLALQVETLLKHYQASNRVGNTAEIRLRWTQKATGIAQQVLEDKKRLPYLEGEWISNVCDELITINAELKLQSHGSEHLNGNTTNT
eukprot:13863802-Ditylum_brightwellii.AAC.1